jgi:hypothetical protein
MWSPVVTKQFCPATKFTLSIQYMGSGALTIWLGYCGTEEMANHIQRNLAQHN